MSVVTVFDPQSVPTGSISEFLHWYDLTTEWAEDRDYDSTAGTAEVLLPWYEAMRAQFPPHTDGAEETTRYIIGSSCIYARFAESSADAALSAAAERARAHGLGVYVSGSGEVVLADGSVLT
ncbi:hypothetical protein [Corynebacterium yudongzhengii]|uniref:hypothetical protein n=1 Tax=Corynebacterium yudongzhengii TaxID=2080740 RepID=UPI0011B1F57F|nr:hypothetical protein [Corynebacterium yudongzhengii]